MHRVEAEAIDALLPQTQCARCGYAGCLPYAEAISQGAAPINQCPPGGAALIGQLAELLHCASVPLDPARGVEAPPLMAWIDADACIGCARCLPPCPVDAILGAQRQLHTVIAAWCTGCELCVPACPVDCIHMVPWPNSVAPPEPAANRDRYREHEQRRTRAAAARDRELAQMKRGGDGDGGANPMDGSP